jgi:glutamate N-acetyltransferase/amino-acid N-acetyltransferase
MKRDPVRSAIRLPRGFLFSAAAAGIKSSGKLDLALAEAPGGASAAALFTRNRVVAAPLQAGKHHLKATHGRVRVLLVNSGNANCATGAAGLGDCERICRELARLSGTSAQQVFPSSTGIIGVRLPARKIVRALPGLLSARAGTAEAAARFARAIMTTDTRPKLASAELRRGSRSVRILGIAKGAGMIHPQLATMLVYLFTDLRASAAQLKPLLARACSETFNRISVDGDTSTNDTVLLLASGTSGVHANGERFRKQYLAALTAVCRSLAEQIIRDGEGVGHVVRLTVEQARSREEALRVARAIAHSPLVKTAWAGADPNWGRILAAAGASGVPFDPAGVSIFFGPHQVCRRGAACGFDEGAAHRYLSRPEYEVRVLLGRGRSRSRFLTCDLTAAYMRINADYST